MQTKTDFCTTNPDLVTLRDRTVISRSSDILPQCLAAQCAQAIASGSWPAAAARSHNVLVVYLHADQAWSISSADSGQTWRPPIRLGDAIETATIGCRFSHTCALHLTDDGMAVAITPEGIFRSENAGMSWQHLPDAASAAQLDGPVLAPGPVIIEHPNFGLLVVGHCPDRQEDILRIRVSPDQGASWYDFHQDLPRGMSVAHAALLPWRGAMLMLAPNLGGYREASNSWHYAQLASRHGRLPFQPLESSLCAPDQRAQYPEFGPLALDLPALSWNAATQRLEAVIAARAGMPERDPAGAAMTLHRFSTAPHEWLAGNSEWTYIDCVAAARVGAAEGYTGFAPVFADDPASNQRHLFFHLGPAGKPLLYHLAFNG